VGARALVASTLVASVLAGAASAGGAAAAEPAPTISSVSQSASVWREGSALAVISGTSAAPVGTTFSFKADERAQVTFTFVPSYSGRRICHVRADGARTCTRVVAQATLSFIAHKGVNHVRFFGRVSAIAKPLAPASYKLTISARNRAGASAQPALLRFTIVR
jgi:hypothetical protein